MGLPPKHVGVQHDGVRSTDYREATDVGGFLVVVVVGDVARETKVSDLQHVVVSHQDVPRCEVTMYALRTATITHRITIDDTAFIFQRDTDPATTFFPVTSPGADRF